MSKFSQIIRFAADLDACQAQMFCMADEMAFPNSEFTSYLLMVREILGENAYERLSKLMSLTSEEMTEAHNRIMEWAEK